MLVVIEWEIANLNDFNVDYDDDPREEKVKYLEKKRQELIDDAAFWCENVALTSKNIFEFLEVAKFLESYFPFNFQERVNETILSLYKLEKSSTENFFTESSHEFRVEREQIHTIFYNWKKSIDNCNENLDMGIAYNTLKVEGKYYIITKLRKLIDNFNKEKGKNLQLVLQFDAPETMYIKNDFFFFDIFYFRFLSEFELKNVEEILQANNK